MEGITDTEYVAYLAVYQAYAYLQGYENKPTRFRLPDEHFTLGPPNFADNGFDLKKFMMVADDTDSDGAIYYWKYSEEVDTRWGYINRFLTLVCTEDNSMDELKEDESPYLRPHHFFEGVK